MTRRSSLGGNSQLFLNQIITISRRNGCRNESMSSEKEGDKGNWTKICPFAADKALPYFLIVPLGGEMRGALAPRIEPPKLVEATIVFHPLCMLLNQDHPQGVR